MAGLNSNRINLNTYGSTPQADTSTGASGTLTGTERARVQALQATSDVTFRSLTLTDDGSLGGGRLTIGDDAYLEDFDMAGGIRLRSLAGGDGMLYVRQGGIDRSVRHSGDGVGTEVESALGSNVAIPHTSSIVYLTLGAGGFWLVSGYFRMAGGALATTVVGYEGGVVATPNSLGVQPVGYSETVGWVLPFAAAGGSVVELRNQSGSTLTFAASTVIRAVRIA